MTAGLFTWENKFFLSVKTIILLSKGANKFYFTTKSIFCGKGEYYAESKKGEKKYVKEILQYFADCDDAFDACAAWRLGQRK